MRKICNNWMKITTSLFFALLFLFAIKISVSAQTSYVLPYPDEMPGSKFYAISKLQEVFLEYWSFGSFAKAKFHMKYSDKYLVEAKTLYEYNQYLLAQDSLIQSNNHYKHIKEYIVQAKNENKDVSLLTQTLINQTLVHKEFLEKIKVLTPKSFVWNPEKGGKSELGIHNLIDYSIKIRNL